MSWRRNRRRRYRQRLGAKSHEGADDESYEVIDAELSDEISEIEKADLDSQRKTTEEPPDHEKEEGEAPREAVKKVVKRAARAPGPAPAPFTFAGSGFTSLEDAAASGQFVDLSEGRNACLKRVDDVGVESDGNPAKGSKVQAVFVSIILFYRDGDLTGWRAMTWQR